MKKARFYHKDICIQTSLTPRQCAKTVMRKMHEHHCHFTPKKNKQITGNDSSHLMVLYEDSQWVLTYTSGTIAVAQDEDLIGTRVKIRFRFVPEQNNNLMHALGVGMAVEQVNGNHYLGIWETAAQLVFEDLLECIYELDEE